MDALVEMKSRCGSRLTAGSDVKGFLVLAKLSMYVAETRDEKSNSYSSRSKCAQSYGVMRLFDTKEEGPELQGNTREMIE